METEADVSRSRRRLGAATTATTIVLLLLTWWASGAADAAQPLSRASIVAPLVAPALVPRWFRSNAVQESGAIASVGSGLIMLAAFVRRMAGPDRTR
jgi:hypothetical protein